MKLNPFSTEAIALQQRPPALAARIVTVTICLIAACSIAYASFAAVDVVVTAQGRVIPSGKSKVLQPLEAGVVRSISVRDGQRVKAGEVLLELDSTTTAADRDRLQREYWEAEADVIRVQATLAGQAAVPFASQLPGEIVVNQRALLESRLSEHRSRMATLSAELARKQAERDTASASIAQLRASLPLVRQKLEMREDLARTGHLTPAGLIETKLELASLERELAVHENRLKEAEAGLQAARQQVAQAEAEFRTRTRGELMEVSKKRESASQELIKASQRRELQFLRSPIDGVVQQLAVSTIGGVVTQAQPLMTIVPENALLEVEALVMNRDIGHVKVGQRVVNKLETFDFTRYGYIEGSVQWVGTDVVTDPKLGPVYPIRIQLHAAETPSVVNGRKGIVTAGMNVTAELLTDQRRLIEYFIAPLLRYRQEALRER